MRIFEIQDIREFTSHLFLKDHFDELQFCEADFITFASFHLDGKRQQDYFDTDEQKQLEQEVWIHWKEIRPFCLSLIRGKRLPLSFKIVLRLPATHQLCCKIQELGEEAGKQDLFLNIMYKDKRLVCTTGAAMSGFVPGVKPGAVWDTAAEALLRF
ncbi:MAG: hypothetical protein IJ123_03430 [Blautia sp.]|nr:hypothetical protein [Blautia sp.]